VTRRKKSKLERDLEESIKLAKKRELPHQQKDALERRLRDMEQEDLPDALEGD
jgi:hypothetical protein